MKKANHSRLKDVQRAILLMPKVAKEEELRYFEELQFANRTFQAVIRQILKYQKATK